MDKILFKMPVASYDLLPGGPIFEIGFSAISILCDYHDAASNASFRLILSFEGIEVSKLVSRAAIATEVIDEAYEQVVDLGETEMFHTVKSNLRLNGFGSTDLRHLAIYFDGGPGLEMICRKFETETRRADS